VLPGVVVDGTGADEDPVPPVGVVYHCNPEPVAVSAVAMAFWQNVTGLLTVGPGVPAVTFTTMGTRILSPHGRV